MKNYSARFGTGDPRTYTGLSPTFIFFVNLTSGATIAPPSVTEQYAGTGIYTWQWGTTTPIGFLLDAATTSPGAAGRYVTGQLDPVDRADEYGTTAIALGTSGIALGTTIYAYEQNLGSTLVAIGNSSIALGTSNIALGTTAVAIGTTIYAYEQNLGSTLIAIGNTSIAQGTTEIAIGTSIYALEQFTGSTLIGIGNTTIAIGNTILAVAALGASYPIGSTASSFGTLTQDPVDLFGYLKRIGELLQGQQTFIKGSGALNMTDRTGGTTLAVRTIGNNASMVTRT